MEHYGTLPERWNPHEYWKTGLVFLIPENCSRPSLKLSLRSMRYDLHYTTVQSILYQVGYGESTQHMLPACVAEFIEHQQITGSDERGLTVGYFMRCHYGHHRYSFEEIEGMFDGLNWLRRQWPGNDEEKEK